MWTVVALLQLYGWRIHHHQEEERPWISFDWLSWGQLDGDPGFFKLKLNLAHTGARPVTNADTGIFGMSRSSHSWLVRISDPTAAASCYEPVGSSGYGATKGMALSSTANNPARAVCTTSKRTKLVSSWWH
jgi:hypothetical protein